MEIADDLKGLELYQLYDIMEPLVPAEPVSKIPEGPGWWVLLGLLVFVAISVMGWKFYRRYQNRYRYYAIDEVNALPDDYSPWQLSAILKRCALTEFSRPQVAALTGHEWSEFLNQHYPEGAGFSDFNSLSAEKSGLDRSALKQQAIDWLNGFKVTP